MDDELEVAITAAGRDKVFSLVHNFGWRPGDVIPKYVWQTAVRCVERSNSAPAVTPLLEDEG